MDIKSYVSIEITKNDKKFSFIMPAGSPFGEAYDAAYEVLTTVVELSRKAAEQSQQKNETSS